MKTEIPTSSSSSTEPFDLPPETLFDLIASDRRRYTLQYLSQRAGAIVLGNLAEQIAIWEDNITHDHYERILCNLHHNHLPRLVDAGVVRYDADSQMVERLKAADHLKPYLDLVAPADVH